MRPGLLFNHSVKRKHEVEKKREDSKPKSKKEMEKERLETGLKTEIDKSNKGFQLLAKMGYKPETSKLAAVKPIEIKPREGRSGLGKYTQKERVVRSQAIKEEFTERLTGDFRHQIRSKRATKQMESDFRKSQKICERLDLEGTDMDGPKEIWFWPPLAKSEEEKEEKEAEEGSSDEEDIDVSARLGTLTTYLRTTYFYCIWCAIRYDDIADLEANCPGETREVHD